MTDLVKQRRSTPAENLRVLLGMYSDTFSEAEKREVLEAAAALESSGELPDKRSDEIVKLECAVCGSYGPTRAFEHYCDREDCPKEKTADPSISYLLSCNRHELMQNGECAYLSPRPNGIWIPWHLVEKAIKEIDTLRASHLALEARLREREAEIETMCMQAAACMTATSQNTHESKKQRIGRDNPYWTQAYEDVCTSVDREIACRERAEASEHNFAIEHDLVKQAESRIAELERDARMLGAKMMNKSDAVLMLEAKAATEEYDRISQSLEGHPDGQEADFVMRACDYVVIRDWMLNRMAKVGQQEDANKKLYGALCHIKAVLGGESGYDNHELAGVINAAIDAQISVSQNDNATPK